MTSRICIFVAAVCVAACGALASAQTTVTESASQETTAVAAVSTGAAVAVVDTPGNGTSETLVYEVAADGSKDYKTIAEALAAASDPDITKTILVHPGTYELADEEEMIITTDNTHITGTDKDKVVVKGSVNLHKNAVLSSAIFNFRASNCSLKNMTVENTAKVTDLENFKACCLMVGEPVRGKPTKTFRGENLKVYSRTDPSVNRGWGYDSMWFHSLATDNYVSNIEVYAYSDIISIGGELTLEDSFIKVMVPTGGYPFWIGADVHHKPARLIARNVDIEGAVHPFGYVVFGERGRGDVTLINVNDNYRKGTPPEFFIATSDDPNVLKLYKVYGKLPNEMSNVTVKAHQPAKVRSDRPGVE